MRQAGFCLVCRANQAQLVLFALTPWSDVRETSQSHSTQPCAWQVLRERESVISIRELGELTAINLETEP